MLLAGDFDWNHVTTLLFWVFILGGGSALITLINSLAKHWRKVRESEHQAALKQSLVERGMSVEEIERIVRAAPESHELEADETPVVQLTKNLAEQEVPPEALEEILRAFHASDPATQRTLAHTVAALCENGAKAEHILAAVRALARPAGSAESPPREVHGVTDATASFRS
jgi:hypothetical protein